MKSSAKNLLITLIGSAVLMTACNSKLTSKQQAKLDSIKKVSSAKVTKAYDTLKNYNMSDKFNLDTVTEIFKKEDAEIKKLYPEVSIDMALGDIGHFRMGIVKFNEDIEIDGKSIEVLDLNPPHRDINKIIPQ
jgi:hypothetical protein